MIRDQRTRPRFHKRQRHIIEIVEEKTGLRAVPLPRKGGGHPRARFGTFTTVIPGTPNGGSKVAYGIITRIRRHYSGKSASKETQER